MESISFEAEPSARWAVRSREGSTDISAVYVWPGAANDLDALLAQITR